MTIAQFRSCVEQTFDPAVGPKQAATRRMAGSRVVLAPRAEGHTPAPVGGCVLEAGQGDQPVQAELRVYRASRHGLGGRRAWRGATIFGRPCAQRPTVPPRSASFAYTPFLRRTRRGSDG